VLQVSTLNCAKKRLTAQSHLVTERKKGTTPFMINDTSIEGEILLVVEGEEAPNFTLKSDEKRDISLSDYIGKKVVLYFYPKDGTPGCTNEAKAFRDAIKDFEKKNAIILGVSKDSVESHQKFKQKHELPFTLLSDPEGEVLSLYGVWKQKSMFGKTFMGIERTTFLLDEYGVVRKIYRKVRVKDHAQACLLDLTQT
jgi:peroxiredoxin Q/BCP